MTTLQAPPELKPSQKPTIRCAIYTRKSTEEGLEQAFNSLDNQRESAEAYIAAQKHEGWLCLPKRYDDGGFTGGNMERPALASLMKDIQAGKVDCIVVYKVDRLSRSLMDFARMMTVFDKHSVSFVSVTQQFNTTQSMGRLTLNILLSFAQFEREIISERTRDKIAGARKRGMFTGGRPILGYDLDRGKLTVNDDEAQRVRAIFDLYLDHGSIMVVVKELATRDQALWSTKRYTTVEGREVGGAPFDKTRLYSLLTNILYVGKIRHKEHVYQGEHTPIIDEAVWQQVQTQLSRNGRDGGALTPARNKHGVLLKGLLTCGHCKCAMTHTWTSKGNRRYHYYVCCHAQKNGWETCPSPSVPVGQIEKFVVDQIRTQAIDQTLIDQVIAKAVDRSRQEEIKPPINDDRMRVAMSLFGPVWDALNSREKSRAVGLLIQSVVHDPVARKLHITFHPTTENQPVDAAATDRANK